MAAREGADGSRVEDAVSKALAYLAKRDRTRKEVETRLLGQGIAQPVVEEALSELERLDYVNDARFAHNFAEDRRTLDSWGSERISGRLREAGIPEALIAEVTGERGRDEELACALELLGRRLPEAPADDREREKALGLLVRRGYEKELAYDAIRAFERHAA